MFQKIIEKPDKSIIYSIYNVREFLCSNSNGHILILQNRNLKLKRLQKFLKMMKLVLLVALLSFLGISAQDGILADDLYMRNPCNKCLTKFHECYDYYKCSDRTEAERGTCLEYCNTQYNSCMGFCRVG